MPQSAGPTPVRLEIRAGEIAVCGSRLVRIKEVAIDGKVEVEDLASGDHREVSLADLSSRQSQARSLTRSRVCTKTADNAARTCAVGVVNEYRRAACLSGQDERPQLIKILLHCC